ncbi:MAG: alpha/beta hydrolase [Dokdonella sp.]
MLIRIARLVCGLLALVCTSLHAMPVGQLHRTTTTATAAVRDADHSANLRITVWYPAADDAVEAPLKIGPPAGALFVSGSASDDAAFAAGTFPVVLFSHGFGGTARMMGWFGTALARAGYVVVAVDHPGNNGLDAMTIAGATILWERPEDLRAALAAVRTDTVIAPHLDMNRLGVAGFSLGGFTALASAGAQVNMDRLAAFCQAHADDPTCRPQKEAPDMTLVKRLHAMESPPLAALRAHANDDHSIAGVKAVFVMAPGPLQGIDPASLAALKTPTAIVLGDADNVAPPATNGEVAAQLLPNATLNRLPNVGHYDFLGTCTDAGRKQVPLCAVSVPQDATHETTIALAEAFFARNLASSAAVQTPSPPKPSP